MLGNNKTRIAITPRDRLLLKELAVCKIIDRELAKEIAGFRTTSTVNERLLKLHRAGLLKRFFLSTRAGGTKALYCLSKKGALEVQVPLKLIQRKSNSLLIGDQFVEHQLALNSIWAQAKFRSIPAPDVSLLRWLTFPSALSKQTPLIPDGYFEASTPSGHTCLFCEVDRGTESLKVWDKKISLYLQLALTGEFQVLFKQSRFRVLVAVHSERRLQTLRKATLKHTDKIFWFATLEDINCAGLFASIWNRPDGSKGHSLI